MELRDLGPATRTRRRPGRGASVAVVALVGLLAGCGADGGPEPTPSASPTATAAAEPGPTPAPTPTPTPTVVPVVDVTSREDVVTGLDAPWGLDFLPDGRAVVTLRDRAEVLLVDPDGNAVQQVTGPGADELASGTAANGEGGLLGVAVVPQDGDGPVDLVLYRTTWESGNQVLRGTLDGTTLGELDVLLTDIPSESFHNGGHVTFGPDDMLWVTTGDAGITGLAQDPDSLAGKILRLTPDGEPAPGNPTEGSPVWSLGHRNVQGLDWADDGRAFASEFGQNRLDELNLIDAGANYGWPDVEGTGGGDGYTDPLVTWSTDEASPSGLAVTDEGVYLAALRGQRLWRVPLEPDGVGEPQVVLDDLGRLRRVVEAPDGSLWVMTNNTDGRGDPRDGDDRIVRVTVAPAG